MHRTHSNVWTPEDSTRSHPLVDVEVDDSIHNQVRKHLAGQFEWLVSYPAPSSTANPGNIRPHNSDCATAGPDEKTLFGCTLLSRRRGSASNPSTGGHPEANRYEFLATPLQGHAQDLAELTGESAGQEEVSNMAVSHTTTFLQAPSEFPGKVELDDRAISPSITHSSTKSDTMTDQPSPAGSFSHSRIEDSLEELDRLEDQLEAIAAATHSEQGANLERRKSILGGQGAPSEKKDRAAKRVTIALGQSATVRVKPSDKARPALRRSNSLTFHEKDLELDPTREQKAVIPLTKAKPSATRAPGARTPVKSTKAPTIPNFELPGEAVARRLKEQREARQAQQAEAQKAAAANASVRVKASKPLTKPNFELPGEAISRRKREEREAKLKAEEEEARKRREFKARPVMHSASSNSLVRDTAASRARQNKISEDTLQEQANAKQSKRLSATIGRSAGASWAANSMTLPARGRNSFILPVDDANRAASSSTAASTSGKRSSVSFEDVVHQRARAKEIFVRDNSYSSSRDREKRERETSARLAREQAAERSRAASREWAEKKRQKEQAQREALRARNLD